jgi:hypothetical protein
MNYRHGDIALMQIKNTNILKGLTKSNTKILVKGGSGGHDHSFKDGTFYPYNDDHFIIGYFVANNKTKLFHPEHGKDIKGKKLKEVKIKTGTYSVHKQQELKHSGLEPIED